MTSLYLSRLMLNPSSRQVQRETADPYQLHITIMNAFGAQRDQAGVLHRLEFQPRSGAITLLVQSAIAPNWDKLPEDYLQPLEPFSTFDNPAVKEIELPLDTGKLLRFRLCANPTVKKKREGKHSNRVPLVREETQIAWLQRKAEQHGFHLLGVSVSNQSKQNGRKRRGQPVMTLVSVQFDGRLQITNADKFQEAIRQGIGPAKAFGCGLLSLAPG